jgi:Adenosyl cobinamide kinase/adenosyl cobinamide phosphate guanylyltransferase
MATIFRDHLGLLHQQVAAISKTVIMMVAGIPMFVKGQIELS